MKAVDSIKCSMKIAGGFSEALLRDMADEPFTRTMPGTGQHPYWLAGHLAVSEAAVLDMYLLDQPNRHASWQPMFGTGTEPAEQKDGAPTYGELLDALGNVRAELLEYIDTLDDDGLDRPCCENDWPGPKFGSVGECLNALSLHMCVHAGQVACARRAAGRRPISY